jgi:hypothetical protein
VSVVMTHLSEQVDSDIVTYLNSALPPLSIASHIDAKL